MPDSRASNWMREYPLRVEMTHQRVAVHGHRIFNASFLALNLSSRPSQPDPNATFTDVEFELNS